MKKYRRFINLQQRLRKSSQFLFGPRGVGKSFQIRECFAQEGFIVNLIKSQDFMRLSENPSLLEAMIDQSGKNLVIVDEIQRIPELTNEVHRLIEEKHIRFLLTGSSARKLKRGQSNLLAGRARWMNLWPLTWIELEPPQLQDYLLKGGLPEVWQSDDWVEFLNTYIDVYLKEEIMAEQLARNLTHFSRFLKSAAICSGKLINFSKLASDASLPASTVKNYFDVLADTMVGKLVVPWTESKKRKSINTAKFYFFDIGVRNRILGLNEIPDKTEIFRESFEHFIFSELNSYLSYTSSHEQLHYWRSVNQHEVDFIVGSSMAIEVKASNKVTRRDSKNLRALREEEQHNDFFVVSLDPIDRTDDGIQYLHWKSFLHRLWDF